MHHVFVEVAKNNIEKDLFFDFFTFDEFDPSQQRKKGMISQKLRLHLFNEVLAHIADQKDVSVKAYECFETNFFFVN